MKRTSQNGQTLAEIVVALGIVLILLSGLVSGATSAVKTNSQTQKRSLAVTYSQEALELSRKLRDEDWDSFQARSGLWCLNKDGVWTQGAPSCPVNIDSFYTRGVTFTWNEAGSRMEVVATVSWPDGGSTHQSQLTTFFTQWQ